MSDIKALGSDSCECLFELGNVTVSGHAKPEFDWFTEDSGSNDVNANANHGHELGDGNVVQSVVRGHLGTSVTSQICLCLPIDISVFPPQCPRTCLRKHMQSSPYQRQLCIHLLTKGNVQLKLRS